MFEGIPLPCPQLVQVAAVAAHFSTNCFARRHGWWHCSLRGWGFESVAASNGAVIEGVVRYVKDPRSNAEKLLLHLPLGSKRVNSCQYQQNSTGFLFNKPIANLRCSRDPLSSGSQKLMTSGLSPAVGIEDLCISWAAIN